MAPLRSTGAGSPNCANGASRCKRSVTSRRHSRTLPLDSARASPQDWIVHAIAKRRHAPVSRTAPEPREESAAITTYPGNSGPNNSGVLSVGSAVTARPVSVSIARRAGSALSGATIQAAPRSSGRGGRSATAYAGAPTARPTWTASHSGIDRTAASPEANGGGELGSTSTSPNATRSSDARRRISSAFSGPLAAALRAIPACPDERDHRRDDRDGGDNPCTGYAHGQRGLIDRPVQAADDFRRVQRSAPGNDGGETREQRAEVPAGVVARADAAPANAERADDPVQQRHDA